MSRCGNLTNTFSKEDTFGLQIGYSFLIDLTVKAWAQNVPNILVLLVPSAAGDWMLVTRQEIMHRSIPSSF